MRERIISAAKKEWHDNGLETLCSLKAFITMRLHEEIKMTCSALINQARVEEYAPQSGLELMNLLVPEAACHIHVQGMSVFAFADYSAILVLTTPPDENNDIEIDLVPVEPGEEFSRFLFHFSVHHPEAYQFLTKELELKPAQVH